ncbi:collagenase 3-like [Antedon mediterranea]|uniref:collagenase 3-like n=1 Tax=Antedon mediterranea TaxID=105859 RepID=UPI003AF8785D
MGPSEIRESDRMKKAITQFQTFYGIRVTGEIDAETLEQMDKPRCGVPDPTIPNEDGNSLGGRLNKRYAIAGEKWEKQNLTYRIKTYPKNRKGLLTNDDVDEIIARAFRVWSDVTPLQFVRIESKKADIELSFGSGYHGDLYPFDGPRGLLAHAYLPGTFGDLAGDVHFDDDEVFTQKSTTDFNLFQVAAHEIGHSLGLKHSNVDKSLMYPAYQGYQASFTLPDDDRIGIQYLYGSSGGGGPRPTYTSGKPEGCNQAFTAVGYLRTEIFAFKNDRYWRIPSQGFPTNINGVKNKALWGSVLPDDVDAVYERPDASLIFFKGENYYIYDANNYIGGPLSISSLTRPDEPSLPNNIDAVLTYYEFRTTYFFKGDLVWQYDEERKAIAPGFPTIIGDRFKGVPNHLTAAYRYNDGNVYFLKGKVYYRYNERVRTVEKGFPRLYGIDFLGCRAQDLVSEDNDGTSAAVSISSVLFLTVSSLVSVLFVI